MWLAGGGCSERVATMGVVIMRLVWLECINVISGWCCKEVCM